MADFITSAIPDGADVPKVDFRAWANTRVPQLTNVAELRSADFGAIKAVIIGASIYVRVPSDTTSVDDGNQVIVDAGGNRWVRPSIREVLTANRTYYVRTDGSDINDGLENSSGGAFLTIQKAWDTILTLDLSGNAVTISIGAGTFTSGLSISSWPRGGNVNVAGAGGTTIISTSGTAIAVAAPGGTLGISSLAVTSSGGSGISASAGATLALGSGLVFGSCGDTQLRSEGGYITINGNYSVSGGAAAHWVCSFGGKINGNTKTITLSGTPAFSVAFCLTETTGVMNFFNPTFSGSATGKRYSASLNSVINLYGAGATALPGNAAGTTSTGGQYA